ncbi:hypothetical protein P7K49_001205 [Saguinus oedipus]|uniref:Uncharacterized protein n=1 Tax=Saguinus oedipus TaxID=9490 RepID=A0ABQ9WDT5_SAGOE|nr:hypothetical protein P7K49_001205 [Saguinus oedipus]
MEERESNGLDRQTTRSALGGKRRHVPREDHQFRQVTRQPQLRDHGIGGWQGKDQQLLLCVQIINETPCNGNPWQNVICFE